MQADAAGCCSPVPDVHQPSVGFRCQSMLQHSKNKVTYRSRVSYAVAASPETYLLIRKQQNQLTSPRGANWTAMHCTAVGHAFVDSNTLFSLMNYTSDERQCRA